MFPPMWYSSLTGCKAFYENYFTSSYLTETHLAAIPHLTFFVSSTDTSNICIGSQEHLAKRVKVKRKKAKPFL